MVNFIDKNYKQLIVFMMLGYLIIMPLLVMVSINKKIAKSESKIKYLLAKKRVLSRNQEKLTKVTAFLFEEKASKKVKKSPVKHYKFQPSTDGSEAEVRLNDVSLRHSPSVLHSPLEYLKKGTALKVREYGKSWSIVETQAGKRGYVSTNFLTFK